MAITMDMDIPPMVMTKRRPKDIFYERVIVI